MRGLWVHVVWRCMGQRNGTDINKNVLISNLTINKQPSCLVSHPWKRARPAGITHHNHQHLHVRIPLSLYSTSKKNKTSIMSYHAGFFLKQKRHTPGPPEGRAGQVHAVACLCSQEWLPSNPTLQLITKLSRPTVIKLFNWESPSGLFHVCKNRSFVRTVLWRILTNVI